MKTVIRLFLVLLLAGCASYDGRGLRPGVSSEAEVRGLMGPPAIELAVDDGGKRLAYPRGPLGTQTSAHTTPPLPRTSMRNPRSAALGHADMGKRSPRAAM